MLYVERNEQGDIVAISRDSKGSTAERKEAVDEEILAFLREHASADSSLRTLVELDLKSIRIIDDIVDLLIRKNLIMFSELPSVAQEKLIARKRLRTFIHDSASIVDDTEIL
jgi:uncharacterized NAD(P)/FAD-binding protein YdhS